MKTILYKLFGKPTYFYNPLMEKGGGESPLYSIAIYKHWRKKSTPIVTYVDKDPLKVLAMVQMYMYIKNELNKK